MLTRNYSGLPKWLPGAILEETGPVSDKVVLEDGNIVRRHHDQLLPRRETTKLGEQQPEESSEVPPPIPDQVPENPQPSFVERRYPTREHKAPKRFQ